MARVSVLWSPETAKASNVNVTLGKGWAEGLHSAGGGGGGGGGLSCLIVDSCKCIMGCHLLSMVYIKGVFLSSDFVLFSDVWIHDV